MYVYHGYFTKKKKRNKWHSVHVRLRPAMPAWVQPVSTEHLEGLAEQVHPEHRDMSTAPSRLCLEAVDQGGIPEDFDVDALEVFLDVGRIRDATAVGQLGGDEWGRHVLSHHIGEPLVVGLYGVEVSVDALVECEVHLRGTAYMYVGRM